MGAVETQSPSEPAPGLPDYVLDPNAVLKDQEVAWRYGKAPDYSNTRVFFQQTKESSHAAGSLPDLVQNLVKNWEVEASFKTDLSDWRTIDHEKYTFAINGGPPQTAEHMLSVGTYNAIIAPNQYYSPTTNDFTTSHKSFKRMMPTFAWEVMEVYSGPPRVAFKWRHWGTMKNDYVGFNDQGEKVTAKAHGGAIDIQGLTVADVNDKLQVEKLETWFDPLEMFRQIAPHGIVNKEVVGSVDPANSGLDNARNPRSPASKRSRTKDVYSSTVNGSETPQNPGWSSTPSKVDKELPQLAAECHPFPKDAEEAAGPGTGDAVAAPADDHEKHATYREMSRVTPMQCPFMNKE